MNPLLSQEQVRQIPVEFAPLLVTGYNIPVHFFGDPPNLPPNPHSSHGFVELEKVDEFLEKYNYIDVEAEVVKVEENKNGKIERNF